MNQQTNNQDQIDSQAGSVQYFAAQEKVYHKAVSGRFRGLKWTAMIVCLAIYYLSPFLRWARPGDVPDQAILINRAQHADLSISMIRIAWELQLAEYKETWKRIENSSLADLGRAFAREAFVDFRSLNNGAACAAVFEAWFLSERCRYHDKKLIQIMLADYQGHVFGSQQASRNISIDLICSLGEQPFGKNYLSTHAQMILSDPVFTEIRDRSNANFLWFIKFEQSFRETERHLQSSDIKTAPEDLEGHIMNTLEDRNHDSNSVSPASSAGSNSNIVYVSFGALPAKRDEVL